MNIAIEDTLPGLERYRVTAQAIGLIELLGNAKPNDKQVYMAERLIRALNLSWSACTNQRALLQALKLTEKKMHLNIHCDYEKGVAYREQQI